MSDVDLFVGSADGGAVRDVSADLDRNLLSSFAWLPDGSGVVVLADDHVGSKLYMQPLHGQGHSLNLGTLNPLEVTASSDDGALAVVADSATQAPELYLMRTPDSTPKRLTPSTAVSRRIPIPTASKCNGVHRMANRTMAY